MDGAFGAIDPAIEAKLRRAGKGIGLVVGGGMAEKSQGQMLALLRDAHATCNSLMSGATRPSTLWRNWLRDKAADERRMSQRDAARRAHSETHIAKAKEQRQKSAHGN